MNQLLNHVSHYVSRARIISLSWKLDACFLFWNLDSRNDALLLLLISSHINLFIWFRSRLRRRRAMCMLLKSTRKLQSKLVQEIINHPMVPRSGSWPSREQSTKFGKRHSCMGCKATKYIRSHCNLLCLMYTIKRK